MPYSDPEKDKAASKARYERNKARRRALGKIWYENNRAIADASSVQWKLRNPGKVKDRLSDYYQTNKEALAAKSKSWAAKNPDKVLQKSAVWRSKHPEESRRAAAAYRQKNPESVIRHAHNRRAKIKAVGGKLSRGIAGRMLERQKGKCACCKVDLRKIPYQLDHITPLARGGRNVDRNIQILCAPCNQSKRARDPIDFMRSRGFLL